MVLIIILRLQWFLYKIDNIVQTVYALKATGSIENIDHQLKKWVKKRGVRWTLLYVFEGSIFDTVHSRSCGAAIAIDIWMW